MEVKTRYEHIGLNNAHSPVIIGSKMKVVELVLAHLAYGWSPEELHFQFPYLSMGQIYSALAYYWDHQEELDHDIETRLQKVDQIHNSIGNKKLTKKLKDKGFL